MALSFSTTFVSCGDDNDINLAKEIAGTYNGYSVGECDMFSDYLLGDQSSATITGNEDGSINLVYKSGSGDFRLNNLKLSSKSFSGSGEVVMSMGSGTGSSYNYTLEGSVNESKVLTLKTNVDIPTPMGEMEIVFMQGETPITYNIAATYQYNSSLSISVGDTSYGTTDECKAVIKRVSDTTVDITLSGFANLSGAGGHMSLGNFTISGVNVTAGANGTYSLSLGEYESTDSNGKAITGESLSGTIAACNGLFENIYDAPTETEMEIKENSFSQIKTVEYTEWAYIDFSGRKVTTVKIGKEYESEIPDNWDIAIHRYDIKTNEGAAYQTSYTSFDALKANGKLPDDKDFVKDEWTTDKIAIDMSGMMEGNIVYTDSYYNSVLSTWLNVDTSTMPPIYTMSNQVYLIRLKDNTYAAIRFTNYTNAKGIKGYIDFDFLYPFDFEKNN